MNKATTEYNEELYKELYEQALILFAAESSVHEIEEVLNQKANDAILVAIVIAEAKKVHYEALRKKGYVYLFVGSFIALLGFLITCVNFNTGRGFYYAMYGFTSLGICIIFIGLYKVIG